VIKHTSFKHGWYYHYRVHKAKSEMLEPKFASLKSYLFNMFTDCPHEFFSTGPRGSRLKFSVPLSILDASNHEVCKLAELGLKINKDRFSSAHSKVQVFMLENDNKTLAMEVPIWANANELKIAYPSWKINPPLTGHIDILRMEDGKIWIWDYKPNAAKEKYAATQVYFYALMLSIRTGIPIDKFGCGYFDNINAFIFKPAHLNNMPCSIQRYTDAPLQKTQQVTQ